MKLYTTPLIGMLCSALVIGNSYAATFVASKSYVDNKVEDKIVDNVTNKAPSQNAVYDALANKQNNLGGGTNSGKVVTATATAGTVTYTGVDSTNVVTSGNTGQIPTVGGVQAGIAKQGDATADWNTVTDSTKGTSVHLVDAKTKQDEYVPTVKAVETRIQTIKTSLNTNINAKEDKSNKVTSIGSGNTDTQYPSAKAVYTATNNLSTAKQDKADSTVTGTKGTDFHYITADNKVGNNLKTLDKQVKTNADAITAEATRAKAAEQANENAITAEVNRATTAEGQLNSKISTNSGLIATINGDASTAGSIKKAVADEAAIARAAEQANASAIAIINGDASTTGSIKNAVANKADKGTTLAAYGITNAYTKADVYTKSETNIELAKKEDNSNKATTEDNWENIASTDALKNTKYPTVGAVQKYVSNTYLTKNLANVPNGTYANISAGTGVANNLVSLNSAVTTIQNNAVVKNADLPVSASAKNSVVTYDDQGLVTGGFQLENGGIKSIENADSATLCSTTNPCILTYLGGTGAAADYRWTPMDEGTETIPAKSAS